MKLSPIEEKIIKIANELTKNKPLNLEELYSIAIKEIKESKNDISQAIYQLILNNFIIEGSKITKDMVLENNTRNAIFEYIYEKPGSHLREIRDILNLSPRLVSWHLKML
ncbi:MAG: winged helix-turn-helix transcriptional regulator, partial [Promethearchaeota archaeon]